MFCTMPMPQTVASFDVTLFRPTKPVALGGGLHALGDDLQAERVAHPDDDPHELGGLVVDVDLVDERLVDLERVDREGPQRVQR